MVKQLDMTNKEELVAAILCDALQKQLEVCAKREQNKLYAIERYMRTYLRGLTPFELEFELKYWDDNKDISPALRFRVQKASDGYDAFMRQRSKVKV